ncbi:MAG: hypothetical protein HDS15_05140 [Bacteroides sp.]|nr:hypothetical protein [Bacteroides sp.]
MSEDVKKSGYELEKEIIKQSKHDSIFVNLLEIAAAIFGVIGLIGGIWLCELLGGYCILIVLSGFFLAVLFHLCALIAKAVEKYLNKE